jgi:hypothetical protein
MPRVSAKDKRIEDLKSKAPKLPPNTCPYINFVIEIIEDHFQYDDKVDELRKTTVIETLEYIRKANETLRDSSKYWYDQYKKVA